jgi:hypothetical protein
MFDPVTIDTITIPILFLICAAIVVGIAMLSKDEFNE